MKKSLSLIIFLLLLWNTNASDTTRVLFVGNSITYFNEMPIMFQEIANNQGKNVKTTMYAPGGTGFVNHVADANVFNLFRNSYWDIVVLQPGSGESAGSTFPVDTTIKRGRILLDSIYRYSPCAKVYLYEIPYGVPSAETWATYFSVQTIIKDSVLKMTDSLQLQMIPAGECARAYYSAIPNLLLHNSFNDIHPSTFGSFLTASAFYTGIFQESVSGCTYYSTIDPDSARNFFAIADSIILNHLTDWRINNHQITSEFSYTISEYSVSFNCLSLNHSNVFWDFGDGNTSTIFNPNHTYLNPGLYTATLYSYNNNGCWDSINKEINIVSTKISNEISTQIFQVLIFPNPTTHSCFIESAYPISQITLYSLEGKLLEQIPCMGKLKTEIDLSQYAKGIYLLKFHLENGDSEFTKVHKL